MDCYLEMMKEMIHYRMAQGETEAEAVDNVHRYMFSGAITMDIQEAMYVAMQSCREKYLEFNAEYQRLGKLFQEAVV